MTSANTNKHDPTKTSAVPPTVATAPPAGVKRTADSITVVKEPPQSGSNTTGTGHFASSKITPRTPPQSRTRPVPSPKGPGRVTRGTERAMTPFDTEDDDLSDCEDLDSLLGPKTMPEPPYNATKTLNDAVEMLRTMRAQGQNITIKNTVIQMLEKTVQNMEK